MSRSLYFRLLALVAAIVVVTVLILSIYSLRGFMEASVFQLEHEVVMLADVVGASIAPLLADGAKTEAIQERVDRIAASRERNDIEFNIFVLEEHRSSIIASNIPDNIGIPSIYEHRDAVSALNEGDVISFVGRDRDGKNEKRPPPSHPDYYIESGHRFISVTSPILLSGQKLGAINAKISLSQFDESVGAIRRGIILVGVLLPIIAVLLMGVAIKRGLAPVGGLTREIAGVESSSLSYRLDVSTLPRELLPIGARVNELIERLETAFNRERRFTADVAHELRTPIATLKTIAQVGIQELARTEEGSAQYVFFEDVLAVTNQMERLVVNLLGLVRCEANQIKVRSEKVDLRDMVESTWEVFREQAEEKKISCGFDWDGQTVLSADRTLTEGMLTNLFSNGVRYTRAKGSMRCSLAGRGEEVVFELANTVNGLTREDLEHMVEPFWQKADSRTDSTHCGIGLCLVSAYSRVLGVRMELDLPNEDTFLVRLVFPSAMEDS